MKMERINDILKNVKEFYVKYKLKYITAFLFLGFWVLYTLASPFMKLFCVDELWYYTIAQDMSFIDIIKIMHYEGHTFLWYIMIKPFTNIDIYNLPYAIKYINWIFSFLTVILFWIFAPINDLLKGLIILSFPLMVFYPVHGCPYSTGMFLLMLLTILYKKRLQKPLIYSVLIFLAANTHLMVTFCALAFAFLFSYDYIKEYKSKIKSFKNILPIAVIVLTVLSLIIQWVPVHFPTYIKILNYNKAKSLWLYIYNYESKKKAIRHFFKIDFSNT